MLEVNAKILGGGEDLFGYAISKEMLEGAAEAIRERVEQKRVVVTLEVSPLECSSVIPELRRAIGFVSWLGMCESSLYANIRLIDTHEARVFLELLSVASKSALPVLEELLVYLRDDKNYPPLLLPYRVNGYPRICGAFIVSHEDQTVTLMNLYVSCNMAPTYTWSVPKV